MSDCPVCHDELDDGYCHSCQHDLFDEPEWFLEKSNKRIKLLEAVVSATFEVDGAFRLRDAFEGEEIDALFAALKAAE